MLVLSRKRNEKIIIGEDISVVILDIHGEQVQLGIEAPRSIPVHRFEVYQAIKEREGAGSEETPEDGEAATERSEAETPSEDDEEDSQPSP